VLLNDGGHVGQSFDDLIDILTDADVQTLWQRHNDEMEEEAAAHTDLIVPCDPELVEDSITSFMSGGAGGDSDKDFVAAGAAAGVTSEKQNPGDGANAKENLKAGGHEKDSNGASTGADTGAASGKGVFGAGAGACAGATSEKHINGADVDADSEHDGSGVVTKKNTVCACCGKRLYGQIKRCGTCQSTFYCNRSCQKTHWKSGHKQKCKKRQKELVADTARMANKTAMKLPFVCGTPVVSWTPSSRPST
jgi:hypothetical protein